MQSVYLRVTEKEGKAKTLAGKKNIFPIPFYLHVQTEL